MALNRPYIITLYKLTLDNCKLQESAAHSSSSVELFLTMDSGFRDMYHNAIINMIIQECYPLPYLSN